MKKANLVLLCLLFGFTILLPLGTLMTVWFGYKLEFVSVTGVAFFLAVLSASVVFLSRIYGIEVNKKAIHIILIAIAPLSLLNAAFFMFESHRIPVVVSVLISAVCCCSLTVNHGKSNILRTVTLSLSVLMALPIGFFSLSLLVFGNFVRTTVVKTVVSPNEKYYAQVINSDQGGLGGDTIVDVRNNGFNAIIFQINKKPQRVYQGEWGEFEDMQIYWKDNSCLVINSVEYNIET